MRSNPGYPGDEIWERLTCESGPITDARRLDDKTLAAAIRERRALQLHWQGDGYAGKYIWLTLLDDPELSLVTIRYGGRHLRRWWTVVFARPLRLDAAERQRLDNPLGGVSWESFSEMPHLPPER